MYNILYYGVFIYEKVRVAYGPLPSRSCGGLGGPFGLRKNIGWGQKLARLPDYEAAAKYEWGTKINLCYILSTGATMFISETNNNKFKLKQQSRPRFYFVSS